MTEKEQQVSLYVKIIVGRLLILLNRKRRVAYKRAVVFVPHNLINTVESFYNVKMSEEYKIRKYMVCIFFTCVLDKRIQISILLLAKLAL